MGSSAMLFPVMALLLGLLHIHCGEARVLTEVPWGPLYRVVGYSVCIPCNVSGFMDAESNKKFEFRMQKLSDPNARDINIISTDDPSFAYSVFSGRVSNNEITLEYEAPNSVLFTMTNLLASDEGKYECSVKNEEDRYDGVYFAKIILKVIEDTLTVSSPDSTSASVDEGDPLTLTCRASSNTVQHTHLSVTWYLHKDGQENPIVSLDQDLTLIPGPRFEERYRAGAVRLDKVGEATYRLNIAQLEPSDQGRIYCQTREWIQDPDSSWSVIAQKRTEVTSLMVKAKDQDFLGVTISVQQKTLQEGQELALTCSVDNMAAGQFFSVAWLCNGAELAHFGPTGVLQVGAQYRSRQTGGELMATKTGDRVHRLVLRPVRVQDQGGYLCRVWGQDRGPDGGFTQGAPQDSSTQTVSISATESNITVSLSSNTSEVLEGDVIQLTCLVQATSGPLSVFWQWADKQGAGPVQELASVDREGSVRPGQAYRERAGAGEIRVDKSHADTYSLFLHNALPGDEGQYRCTATEWLAAGVEPDLVWDKIGEMSATKTITVKTVESSFVVSASSRTPSVNFGDSFDLLCLVKPRHNPRVPASVTWRFLPAAATPGTDAPAGNGKGGNEFRELVTFTREGTLQWGEQLLGLGTRTTVDRSHANTNFRLSVTRAGRREAGTYQCTAVLWRRNYDNSWSHVANRTSNRLGISVVPPVSQLRVQKTNQTQVHLEDSRVRINCSVISQTGPDSQHAVLWYVHRAAGSEADELLLRIERSGAFEYGAYADEERLRRRVQAERLSPRLHTLTLNRAETSDSGTYFCLVEEWLSDPDGAWYRLSRDLSGFTHVSVRQPEVRLQVEEAESNITVSQADSIRLGCSIPSQSSRDSRFSVSWYMERSFAEDDDDDEDSGELDVGEAMAGAKGERQCVFSIGHDAVFGNGNCSPVEEAGPNSRLQFERASSDQYSLTIQRAQPADAGRYVCHVEEWLLNPRNAWYRLATNNSGFTIVNVMEPASTLQSVVCANDSLFYFVFFYPFPIFGALLIALLMVRYKSRGHGKSQEGKNGAPLLWIKEPHLSYSPTCLDPPALSLHPGSVD
ncbi:unnamed protein product [Merluccius merluccius]